ncbi:MAG: hypothetical protein KBC56_00690 [Flavobacterium sp.]|nr:hypothetical protein [Flavobacterium sp.]
METGLDFTKGKWILNTIEVPYEVQKTLSNLVFKDFSKKLNNRISYSSNVKEFMITPKIDLKENKSELGKIYKTTGYDFFIELKGQVIDDKLESLDITPSRFKNKEQNRVKVILTIYDLKSQLPVYSKTAIGSVETNESSDVNFSASVEMLIIGAYKKIMKDINSKSIK